MSSKSLLLCSLAGNFVLCIINIVLMPTVIGWSQTHMNLQKLVIFIVFALAAAASVVFLSLMGCFADTAHGKNPLRQFRKQFNRIIKFAAVFICFALIYSILCGLLAMAIYRIWKESLSYDSIKTVIDISTSILTVLAAPALIYQLFSFTFSRLPLKDTVIAGLRKLKTGYLRILLITAAVFIAGGVCSLILSMLEGYVQTLLQFIIYTAVGGFGTYYIYRTGVKIYEGGGTK